MGKEWAPKPLRHEPQSGPGTSELRPGNPGQRPAGKSRTELRRKRGETVHERPAGLDALRAGSPVGKPDPLGEGITPGVTCPEDTDADDPSDASGRGAFSAHRCSQRSQ